MQIPELQLGAIGNESFWAVVALGVRNVGVEEIAQTIVVFWQTRNVVELEDHSNPR